VNKFLFNDLLPSSIKDDPKFKAASQCLDKLFSDFNERRDKLLIYSNIDGLDEQTLDDIAWGWNLGYDNGYSLLETIDEKRALIKNTLRMHQHKGTRWSLESVAGILNIPLTIVEWWEDSSTGLEPFEFDIYVDAGNRDLTPKFYADVNRLVQALKNARSHLRRVQTILAVKHISRLGIASIGAAFVRVMPKKIHIVNIKINSELLQDAIDSSTGNYAVINGLKILFSGNSFEYMASPGNYAYTVYISGGKAITGNFTVGE